MSNPKVTINNDQRLYVISTPGGTSCFGFTNCFNEANALADRLGRHRLEPGKLGTIEAYQFHGECITEAQKKKVNLGTWFDPETPTGVRDVLEAAREKGTKVRLWYGDRETGKAWLEENDVVGKVGRSTGILKVPLIVAPGDDGGSAISTASVLRVDNARTGKTLYQDPKFHVPELTVKSGPIKDLPVEVHTSEGVEARFKDSQGAEKYIAFQQGRPPVEVKVLSGRGAAGTGLTASKSKSHK